MKRVKIDVAPARQIKLNWSFNEKQGDTIHNINSYLTKVPVNAGNLGEIVESRPRWSPEIGEQVERLAQEWADPKSDGTGFLTYDGLTEMMTAEMTKEYLVTYLSK